MQSISTSFYLWYKVGSAEWSALQYKPYLYENKPEISALIINKSFHILNSFMNSRIHEILLLGNNMFIYFIEYAFASGDLRQTVSITEWRELPPSCCWLSLTLCGSELCLLYAAISWTCDDTKAVPIHLQQQPCSSHLQLIKNSFWNVMPTILENIKLESCKLMSEIKVKLTVTL